MTADLLRSEYSRFIECGGHRWHVQVAGAGPGLLLLHGTGASSQSFRALLPGLKGRFTVVAPDLPGQGLSVAPRAFAPALESMAKAVSALVSQLSCSVELAVGHSAGAAILAEMIRHRAIAPRRLVGLAAAMVPFEGFAGVIFPTMARWLSGSPRAAALVARRMQRGDRVAEVLRGTGSRPSHDHVQLYRALTSRPEHVAAVIAMMAHWDLAPLYAALPRLEVPVTLIAGQRDQAVPLAQQMSLVRRLPRAELVVIERAGHLLHEERPEPVLRHVLAAAEDGA